MENQVGNDQYTGGIRDVRIISRMIRVSWTGKRRNNDIMKEAGVERTLFTNIKHRKIEYLGHVLRGEKYELQRLIMEGKIEGKGGIDRKSLSSLRLGSETPGSYAKRWKKAASVEESFSKVT